MYSINPGQDIGLAHQSRPRWFICYKIVHRVSYVYMWQKT